MPPIPKLPTGDYDYLALTVKLTEIKHIFRRDQSDFQRGRRDAL